MKKPLLFAIVSVLLCSIVSAALAQTQTVANGGATTAITFPGGGCVYKWVNNNPSIGLSASGIGNIPSFTAINNTNAPVTATITATPAPPGVAYMSNFGDGTVSVVDFTSSSPIATIAVGPSPSGVSVSPDGMRAYVANFGNATVSVINTTTNSLVTNVTVGSSPVGVAVSPDSKTVYTTNSGDKTVSVIDAQTNTVKATVNVASNPWALSLSPDGSMLYVTNRGSGWISVVSTATNSVVGNIPIAVDAQPQAICTSPDGNYLYVANTSGTVSVCSTAGYIVVATITAGNDPDGICVSQDGSRVYVTNRNDPSISIINTATNAVIKIINTTSVGYRPGGITISPDGKIIYVAITGGNLVATFDAVTGDVLSTSPTGMFPNSLGNFVHFTGPGCGTTPLTYTIIVNAAAPLITASTATGNITACVGTPSSSPNILQFTVSGVGLPAGIDVSLPSVFEVSLSPNSGYSGGLTIPATAGVVDKTIVYVRSKASASAGIKSGHVSLSSGGGYVQQVPITETINALPTVNPVADQIFTNLIPSTAINFTGTGGAFNWVNDNPEIGLASGGTGDIASFVPVNNGSTPATANVTVTPIPVNYAYIPALSSGGISVINTATNQLVTTIPTTTGAVGAAISPDSKWMYISNITSNNVSVINTATNTVTDVISVGHTPFSLCVSRDGSLLYVVNQSTNSVAVVDIKNDIILTNIPVGQKPYGICMSPDGSTVYVVDEVAGAVSVISTASNTVIKTIAVGQSPIGACTSPDGSFLYVTNLSDNTVSVIDTKTNTVTATINVHSAPFGVAVSPDGSRLYVVNSTSNDVSIINTATNAVINTIGTGDLQPKGISVSPDGNEIYVANSGSNTVSVINTLTNTVTKVTVGDQPFAFGNFMQTVSSCDGVPVKFTITVKPAAATPAITAGAVAGNISACAGTASANPNVSQFTVSGSNLSADIVATAPTGFEVSLSPGGGYGSSVTLTQSGGVVNNIVVYTRSAASASVGNISGDVVLTSTGATSRDVPVKGIINALPVMNAVPDQVYTAGQTTTPTNFTGTANYYNWVNDTPAIGLSASGTGSIPAFTAVNSSATPVKATVKVTPSSPGLAYITNQGSNNASVINTETNAIVATIQLGADPNAVAVRPDGKEVYIANLGENSVSVINTATNTVYITIPVGSGPYGITASPDGKSMYVSNFNDNTVSVIKTAIYEISINAAAGAGPYAIAVTPDNNRIYVSDYYDNAVSVLNAATGAKITTINVGTMPEGISISPDGQFVYVVNNVSGNVSVISTVTNTVVKTITVGQYPTFATLNPDGSRLYVANTADNSVSVINTATNAVVATIPAGASPVGLSFNTDGSELYIANSGSGTVTAVNAATNNVISVIQVGISPTSFGNFITHGTGCTGAPVSFKITINPKIIPVITAGTATGTISACAGSASVSPNIQQFTVSATGLSDNFTAIAPTNFQVSLSPGSGYNSSVLIPQTAGEVSNTIIYVRALGLAPPGDISGVVTLFSVGAATKTVDVNGVVKALPTVDAVPDQVVTNGQQTTAINFTGTGNTYNWVNNAPGIGLVASGAGDIVPFTAANAGNIPVKATVTVTPSSSAFAYITNYGDNTVSVINTVTKAVVTKIAVDQYPTFVVGSPDGSKVYVANNNSNTISVINTSDNQVTAKISVGQPDEIRVSPDGSRLYVVEYVTNTIGVVSTASNTEIAHIPVGKGPVDVVVSPDGSTLYVSNITDNTVSVVSTATNIVTAAIGVGAYPIALNISPDGSRVYVSNFNSNNVSVINTATNAVIATVNTGLSPDGLVVSPDGSKAYVANYGGTTVSVIDAATNSIASTITVGSKPITVAVSTDGSLVYTLNQLSHDISVVDAVTNSVIATIPVPANPGGLFISGGTGCTGIPVTFTITVKPAGALQSAITAGAATGVISACIGSPSASPNVQQFTVSGSNLTDNIIATAPAGFEVSLSQGSGFGSSVTLLQVVGSVSNTIVYVRSAASAPAGTISDNVMLTSTGATNQNVSVTGNIHALPTVNAVGNQTRVNGTPTAAINFTGTGNAFTWTNNTPGIGLPASGGGDIASFMAVNTGGSPVTATITVTPATAGFAYIANSVDNNISVINTATNTVVKTIPAGAGPSGVAVSPDGTKAYVSNHEGNTISVISTATNTVIGTITTPNNPFAMVFSPDGSKVYVTYGEDGSQISVVNTATNNVTNITAQNWNYGITVSPDGSKLYIVNLVFNTVSVMNTANNVITAPIPAGNSPYAVAVSPDGSRLYVTANSDNDVLVINTADNTLIATVAVGNTPTGICVSPDGSKVYAVNSGSNSISVINALSNSVTSTINIGRSPLGVSISPDGKWLYAPNFYDNDVSVISTATNTALTSVGVGTNPQAFGNFISPSSGCTGTPVTFTITVTPSPPPVLTVSGVLSALTTVYGTPSPSESFLVSGSNLTEGILVTPPNGFEVSGDGITFSSTVTVGGAGMVSSVPVYIRLTAIAAVGDYGGNIGLSSKSAPGINEAIPLSTVTPAPLNVTANNVIKPFGTTLTGSSGFINFTSTGLQNGESIGSVTITYGAGAAATDAVGTYNASVTLSAAIGGTFSASNYTITYVSADIIVVQPVITIAGTLSPLNTVYGTPSASESFTVSAADLTAGILITPPPGFEVSIDNNTFSSNITVGASGAVASTPVYLRLAAVTPVGPYQGEITLTNAGAADVNENIPLSTVSPAPLTITADNKSRATNTDNPILTATYTGFVNNETQAILIAPPVLTTIAVITSPAGQYPIVVNGAAALNYNITYVDGILTITEGPQPISIPNTFTPNGDGINDTWNIRNLDTYQNCTVMIFNRYGQNVYSSIGYGNAWDGNYKGSLLPTGTYYYIINLKNNNQLLSGFVAIVR